MNITYMVKRAIEDPSRIKPFVVKRTREPLQVWLYIARHGSLVELDGYEVVIDPNDVGISRDLVIDGIREPVSYSVYRNELKKLADDYEETIRVLEAGTNIGYYAFVPPVVRDDVHVYAVEVEESNYGRLEEGIRRNGFGEHFTTGQFALSSEDTEVKLKEHEKGNRHSVTKASQSNDDESQRVQSKRGDSWLSEHNLSPNDIDVLQMDVEGFEIEVLKGLPEIFKNLALAHIEVHPGKLDTEEEDYFIDLIHDMDIVVAARDDNKIELNSIEDIRDYFFIELVLRAE